MLILVAVQTSERLALLVRPWFSGADVAAALDGEHDARGRLTPVVQVNNGAEFTSCALEHWAYWNQVRLNFNRPATPVDKALVEAFNGSLPLEYLWRARFAFLAEAQHELERWRGEYNYDRLHMTLAQQPPAFLAGDGHFTSSRSPLRD